MRRHREPFSYQRHQDVAELLTRVRGELTRLGHEIDECYGASTAEEAFNAIAAVDRVREVLDLQLDRDFPRDPAQVCNVRLGSIYYPPHWTGQQRAS